MAISIDEFYIISNTSDKKDVLFQAHFHYSMEISPVRIFCILAAMVNSFTLSKSSRRRLSHKSHSHGKPMADESQGGAKHCERQVS